MSTEDNKRLIERMMQAFNEQNSDALDEIVMPDYIDYGPFPEQEPGLKGLKQAHDIFYHAFPDVHITIEDIFAEADKVVIRWTGRGTHLGTFVTIPPTRKKLMITGIDIYRIRDGKVVENWHNTDGVSMLNQMGVLSPFSQLMLIVQSIWHKYTCRFAPFKAGSLVTKS